MAMDKLMEEVKECIEREYGRAGAKFGLTNNSDHESYAVVLEELQEAKSDMECFESHMALFWELVKRNDHNLLKHECLIRMYNTALTGACEMIQVAAMAKKAAITVCNRGAVEEIQQLKEWQSSETNQ